jgi:hypothetical protein
MKKIGFYRVQGFKFGFQSNCMVVDFNTKQLNYNLQCNYPNFIQPLPCCFNYDKEC